MKTAKRTSSEESQPFTVDRLTELLRANVVGRLKMPSDDGLVALARFLEDWRQHYLDERFHRETRDLQDRAHKALRELDDVFVRLNERNLKYLVELGDNAPLILKEATAKIIQDNIKARLALIQIRQTECIAIRPQYGTEVGWKLLAEALPIEFKNAMLTTNPNFDPGIGHTGPIASFIAAICPDLTGHSPSKDSVATYLKTRRRAKRGK